MAEDSITVKNTTPGRRFLATDTEVKAGEEKTLTGEDVEAAEIFIEKGDFEVLDGDENVDADESSDEENPEDNKEAKKGVDSESVVKDLPYLTDEQKEQLIEEYDNLYELQEGVTKEDLEGLEDIGEAYAEDIYEAIQNQ